MKLISLLHDLTQQEIDVTFSNDFEGMITVTFAGEGLDWRHHQHLGYPGCNRAHLEEKVVASLQAFLNTHGLPRVVDVTRRCAHCDHPQVVYSVAAGAVEDLTAERRPYAVKCESCDKDYVTTIPKYKESK